MNKIIKTKRFVYSLSIFLVVIGLIGLTIYITRNSQGSVVSEDKKAAPQTAPPPESAPTPIPTQPPVLPEPQKPEMPPNANNEEQITDSEVISDEDSGEPWAPEDECEEEVVDEDEEEPEFPADFLDPKQDPELRQMILDLKLTVRGVEILDDIDQIIWQWDKEIESSSTSNCADAAADYGFIDSLHPDFDRLSVFVPEPQKSTMGHEFLHAVFARLSESEERNLSIKLEKFYQANKQALDQYTIISAYEYITDPGYDIYDLELLQMYGRSRHNEMYAIFGTEVFDVPSDLEEHYSQYFQNRKETFDLRPGSGLEFYSR